MKRVEIDVPNNLSPPSAFASGMVTAAGERADTPVPAPEPVAEPDGRPGHQGSRSKLAKRLAKSLQFKNFAHVFLCRSAGVGFSRC